MRFFIFALPRSRTYWLSRFLTHGDVTCHHELLGQVSSFTEYEQTLGPDDGSAETAATMLWRPMLRMFPKARYLIVRRDPLEVDRSLAAQGITADVTRFTRMLDQAQEGLHGTDLMVVDYADIDLVLPAIWRHCRGDEMPEGRELMRHRNLTCDLAKMLGEFNPQRYWSLQCSSPYPRPSS